MNWAWPWPDPDQELDNNCGNGKVLLMPIVQPRIEVNDDHVDVSTEAREAAVITAWDAVVLTRDEVMV